MTTISRRLPVVRHIAATKLKLKPGDEPGFNFVVFRDTPPPQIAVGRFGTSAMPQPAKRPRFNAVIPARYLPRHIKSN